MKKILTLIMMTTMLSLFSFGCISIPLGSDDPNPPEPPDPPNNNITNEEDCIAAGGRWYFDSVCYHGGEIDIPLSLNSLDDMTMSATLFPPDGVDGNIEKNNSDDYRILFKVSGKHNGMEIPEISFWVPVISMPVNTVFPHGLNLDDIDTSHEFVMDTWGERIEVELDITNCSFEHDGFTLDELPTECPAWNTFEGDVTLGDLSGYLQIEGTARVSVYDVELEGASNSESTKLYPAYEEVLIDNYSLSFSFDDEISIDISRCLGPTLCGTDPTPSDDYPETWDPFPAAPDDTEESLDGQDH